MHHKPRTVKGYVEIVTASLALAGAVGSMLVPLVKHQSEKFIESQQHRDIVISNTLNVPIKVHIPEMAWDSRIAANGVANLNDGLEDAVKGQKLTINVDNGKRKGTCSFTFSHDTRIEVFTWNNELDCAAAAA